MPHALCPQSRCLIAPQRRLWKKAAVFVALSAAMSTLLPKSQLPHVSKSSAPATGWHAGLPTSSPPADTHFRSCSLAVGLLTPRFCWPLLAKEPRYCLRCDNLGSSEAPAWPSCPSQHRAWGDVGTGLRCNPPAPLTPHRAPSQTSSLCAKRLHDGMGPRLALQQ